MKITPQGKIKVLDFGLAKALDPELTQQELANSPPLTMEATQEGIVLGTAAYMSPEQARGKVVDKRTDIWAFGVVLFEMLTGKGMYAGKSLAETLAAVIHQEPSLEELPPRTPWKLRGLLKRCLRKDPQMRLRDIGDARITIAECLSSTPTTVEQALLPTQQRRLWRRLAPWTAVPILAALAWSLRPLPSIPEKPVSRFEIPLEEGGVLNHQFRPAMALSPDGTSLAFGAGSEAKNVTLSNGPWPKWNLNRKLYLRSLDQWKTVLLADDDVASPVYSPDGKWLAVITSVYSGRVKKFPLDGGSSTTICDCRFSYGMSWAVDDTIVLVCSGRGGLMRVSASGGEPEQITELDKEAGEISHRLPHVLPGGEAVLFTVLRHSFRNWSEAQIVVQSLETGERKVLVEDGSDARYVPTGHLVFAREGTLMAVPFDLASLEVAGPPVPVLEGVSHALYTPSSGEESGAAQFAFSNSGSLAYIAGSVYPENKRRVVWVNRDGEAEPTRIDPAEYGQVRVSPDGSEVLLSSKYKGGDIWSYDLARGTRSRQTFEGDNRGPIWTPDGSGITFSSNRTGVNTLFSKSVDSDGAAVALSPTGQPQALGSWSPDGSKLAFVQFGPGTGNDIWILSMEGPRSPEPFLKTRFSEFSPEFSPDGRWMAYVSDESGRSEVYVQRYPGPGTKVLISTDGGAAPAWSRSAKELFYRRVPPGWGPFGTSMMAVQIEANGSDLTVGNPTLVFEDSYVPSAPTRSYDVHPDGQRFLMITTRPDEYQAMVEENYGRKFHIVLNWFQELKRLVPTD